MGNLKSLCIKREKYKEEILKQRVTVFNVDIEHRDDKNIYFKDYEKMNVQFLKKYEAQFADDQNLEIHIIDHLTVDDIKNLENSNVIFFGDPGSHKQNIEKSQGDNPMARLRILIGYIRFKWQGVLSNQWQF